MKVRLTPNSLRYRLDQTDTEILSTEGVVDFTLSLGAGDEVQCVLAVNEEAGSVKVERREGEIVVVLPSDQAEEWLTTDSVGLDEQIEADGQRVQVLVEKDLGCRHGKKAGEATSEMETFDHLREEGS